MARKMEYVFEGFEGDNWKVPDELVAVARALARRTGETVPKTLEEILTTCVLHGVGTPEARRRFRMSEAARKRYCKAEGLNYRTFSHVSFIAACRRSLKDIRAADR